MLINEFCSSEDERLAEACISHDAIVEQSRVPYFSNMGPAQLVIKAENTGSEQGTSENGNMTLIKTKTNGDTNISNDISCINKSKPKKKKKKKKQKQCGPKEET